MPCQPVAVATGAADDLVPDSVSNNLGEVTAALTTDARPLMMMVHLRLQKIWRC